MPLELLSIDALDALPGQALAQGFDDGNAAGSQGLEGQRHVVLLRGTTECLADAPKLGYAEADPAFQRQRLGRRQASWRRLPSLAFGVTLDPKAVSVEGVRIPAFRRPQGGAGTHSHGQLLGVAQRTAHRVAAACIRPSFSSVPWPR